MGTQDVVHDNNERHWHRRDHTTKKTGPGNSTWITVTVWRHQQQRDDAHTTMMQRCAGASAECTATGCTILATMTTMESKRSTTTRKTGQRDVVDISESWVVGYVNTSFLLLLIQLFSRYYLKLRQQTIILSFCLPEPQCTCIVYWLCENLIRT